MKSKNKKIEDNKDKNKEEILNNLLKKLLDKKISKLEKNHKIETKNILELSNTSQNLITSLEKITNNVRKHIYVNRQKLINNAHKLPKKIKIPIKKEDLKSLRKKSSSFKKLPKIKRIQTKSWEKHQKIQTEIQSETGKATDFKNKKLISKDLNTIQKFNNFIKTERISNADGRRTTSPFIITKKEENFNTKIYNKNFIKQKNKTPRKHKNNAGNIKEKEKFGNQMQKNKKSNKKTSREKQQITNQFQSNNQQKNIKNINKFVSTDNSTENIINENNNSNSIDNNQKNDEKNNNNIFTKFANDLNTVDTIKIDDKLVKDSLLVKFDDLAENVKDIDIDDLIQGPTFQEIIIDENIIKKNDDDTNKENKNDLNDKNKKRNDLRNSSLAIYNKLKRCKISFLEGTHDFDLIFKDDNIEDMDIDSNINKEKDQTLTAITEHNEHISLEEKFEANLDLLIDYLDYKDICYLLLVNRECFKIVISSLISKKEIIVDILNEEINKLKLNNTEINFENINKKPFNFSNNSLRAISLLNTTSGNNILKLSKEELNKKEIILIYSLYFVATGKKSKISILDEEKKIEIMQNFFKKNICKNNFGKFIEKELKGKIFEDKEIYCLFRLSKNYLDIISPNYFQKINKDIAIFVFVIKDILEQLGILSNVSNKPDMDYILLNAELETNKAILDELLLIEKNIN